MKRFGLWLIRGEGARIVYGYEWEWTPEWLFHCSGNAMLVGFYVPAIVWIVFLAAR